MMVFLLALLFVVVIPLAQGALLALVLREIHIRHPLPLGGSIAVFQKPSQHQADSAEIQESTAEPAESAELTEENGETIEEIKTILDGFSVPERSAVDSSETENTSPPEISVFDNSKNSSGNLHVNDILDSMTAETPAAIPDDFERRIEEGAAHASDAIPPELQSPGGDEMNYDDLLALSEALPGTKIDFTQDIEERPKNSDAISPMAKELLGENFDFEALEKQAKESSKFLAPDASGETPERNPATDLAAAAAIDVQEDESGNVQATSPYMFSATPQLAGFTTPQTILSTFSDDWIQKTESTIESAEGDASKFCFTEELTPMFTRKKKSKALPQ